MAAVSSPERLTVTERTPAPPPPEVEVKVIGIGSRGGNAISKLVAHGKVRLLPEQFCLATHVFCCCGRAHAAASTAAASSMRQVPGQAVTASNRHPCR